MERLDLGDAWLDYAVEGTGEPVLFIHPGITADGLPGPLRDQHTYASSYQLITYRRRGYAGTPAGSRPMSVGEHAHDAAALLSSMGVTSAHIVGHSSGGTIALQLAYERPDLVRDLALLEPAILMVPGAEVGFRRFHAPALERYHAGDRQGAVELFLTGVYGQDWRRTAEAAVPGIGDRVVDEAHAFFGAELPALRAWTPPADLRARVSQPILSVVGTESLPFAFAVRQRLHEWFEQVEDFDVRGANHLLHLSQPAEVARGLHDFAARHPSAVQLAALSRGVNSQAGKNQLVPGGEQPLELM